MPAVTEGTGQRVIGHRAYPAGAAGRIGAGSGVAYIIGRRHIGGQPFLIFSLLQFLFLLGNLQHHFALPGFRFLHQGFKFVAPGTKRIQKGRCLRLLHLQLGLCGHHGFPGAFQAGLFLFQTGLGLSHHRGGIAQLFQTPLVRGGDLLHHIHPVQQVGKAAGLEDHGPVGKTAVLFHGADALLVALVQVIVTGLSRVQLFLLVGDQDAVGPDLLVGIYDLCI